MYSLTILYTSNKMKFLFDSIYSVFLIFQLLESKHLVFVQLSRSTCLLNPSTTNRMWYKISFYSPRLVVIPRLKDPPSAMPFRSRERIVGFIPFPRLLVHCEMQSFIQIWTQGQWVHFLWLTVTRVPTCSYLGIVTKK